MKVINQNYINREYSWLLFNKRVLEQAIDDTNPLLERCKFLSIFTSNFDEFFMVRVGSLYNQSLVNNLIIDNKTMMNAEEQLLAIYDFTKSLYKESAIVFNNLKEELKTHEIRILKGNELSKVQYQECKEYFNQAILPLLSPMVLDAKHPLISLENLKNYFICKLKKNERPMYGVMPINPKIPKMYQFKETNTIDLILIEEIIKLFGEKLFIGYSVVEKAIVRVTRNADFESQLTEREVDFDFTKYLKGKIAMRAKMAVVRLEIDENAEDIKNFLLKNLNIKKHNCFSVAYYFDYRFLFELDKFLSPDIQKELKYPPFKRQLLSYDSLIEQIYKEDILLFYPYDDFDNFSSFLFECARHKDVSSIKITIYRLNERSKVVEALCKASENGKEVVVVIELFARFDEENNMHFADILKKAGCTIIFGVTNYKIHTKILSVVFQAEEGIKYITHLGTGNYNESSAKVYTDLNILTADKEIGEDAASFFRNIAIDNVDYSYKRLLVAPFHLKNAIIRGIEEEEKKQEAGQIIFKMNSMTDKEIIDKLYGAAKSGVKITLIIRGICCLKPNSEYPNLKIISIVGRFLEHSRIYSFGKNEEQSLYISSADLMTRNTVKRVEILTPIIDERNIEKINNILDILSKDNVKSRVLSSSGVYQKTEKNESLINAQEIFTISYKKKL